MSINRRRINKTWHVHTMEYYSDIKRNEIMIPAATRMNNENMMLSERSWTQRDTYCKYIVSRIGNFIETESRIEVSRARPWGRGTGKLLYNGDRVSG